MVFIGVDCVMDVHKAVREPNSWTWIRTDWYRASWTRLPRQSNASSRRRRAGALNTMLVAVNRKTYVAVLLLAPMATRLSDRVAVITGGARGIGLACALSMAKEGAKVVLADIDLAAATESARALEADGMQALAVQCDVRKKTEVDALVARTVEWAGYLDIMVANAGIVKAAPFLEMSEEDFDLVVSVNLKGVFLCCQAAAKQMVKQVADGSGRKPGSIITMSSVNAIMAIPSIAGYNAAKGGVNGLTKNMALALASHGIRVNGIGPGSIKTDVLASVVNDSAAMQRVLSRTPLGRIGEPEEIGQLAAYLASSDASYITGQIIYADGGRLALNYTC